MLRRWGLPAPGDSKKTRGRVMVAGGSRQAPGALVLAGEAALRVRAGRLGLIAPASIQVPLGLRLPEAGTFALGDEGSLDHSTTDEISDADCVLIGPGFDDAEATRRALVAVVEAMDPATPLVLDAFALGVLPDVDRRSLPSQLVLNPNQEEAGILLGRPVGDDLRSDAAEIARRFDATVNCYGTIVSANGDSFRVDAGGAGLATAGSGDVLAGAIAGFCAQGMPAERAAVWGSWVHARAGDRLTRRAGLGFLARDLLPELTAAVAEVIDS
ncbi:ADP/ATP-dependent (S)-NAD(P)H-hydrate dehydratase [Microbacterium sp. CFBP9034]|uniref:ADP-dependent NAD(P)H-hydrate dehydratase n=1 Tax=Microbacterium sp. CFBP9034 TaxID=3096540 RepID=UPI002A6A1A8D|nr:ADP/ATP-dependent (S)-NAD(P)H-hydrate dehydratase [Microbacterium sp. CFBP9034]MDY0908780.1 ADP/ATP-dependent (S)-NAD(P)H-hydrate dehydratase [Microbacterium sp. CFBP9034]